MYMTEKCLALAGLQEFGQIDQHAWIPEPQQGRAPIRQGNVEVQLQQLRQPFKSLRRDEPGNCWRILLQRRQRIQQVNPSMFGIDQPRSGMGKGCIRGTDKEGDVARLRDAGLTEVRAILNAVYQRVQTHGIHLLSQLREPGYHIDWRLHSRTTVALPAAAALTRQSRQTPEAVPAAIFEVDARASAFSSAAGSLKEDRSDQIVVIWPEINLAPHAVESI